MSKSKPLPENIPHTPWFICSEPTTSGLAVIENGTEEGNFIAECEWCIAKLIVETIHRIYPHEGD